MQLTEKNLKSLDLTTFNGGVNPFPEGDTSLEKTFVHPIDYYRETVGDIAEMKDGRVLDLLCGAGRWTVFLAEQNREVVGIDHLEGAINIAKGICEHFKMNNTRFYCKDVAYIKKFPAGHFDGVWVYSAMQYVKRGYVMNQINRLLKPGGKVFVAQYNSLGLMLFHVAKGIEAGAPAKDASRWALQALNAGEQADGNPNYITPDGVSELCGRFGFNVVKKGFDSELATTMKTVPTPDIRDKEAEGTPGAYVRAHYPQTTYFLAEKNGEPHFFSHKMSNCYTQIRRVLKGVKRKIIS